MSTNLSVRLKDGSDYVMYEPTPAQLKFHESSIPKLIAIGNRGGGKSLVLRMDAHMRALSAPGSTLVLVRQSFPQLLSSHLGFIRDEMNYLGGYYNKTEKIAYYPNGSRLFFSYVGGEADSLNQLSSEYLGAYFDELSTIPWEFFMKIVASVRVKANSGLTAVVRAATNPLGQSADQIRQYFVDHDVDPEENQEYFPQDWGHVRIDRQDNPHIDAVQYVRQFSGFPEHIKKAWLDGDFALENALFDLHPNKDGRPYHVINDIDLPVILKNATIYRAVDAGWYPDPTICLWIAHLGNRYIVFKEKLWYRTVASDIAADIKDIEDMMGIKKVFTTYCDPTMDQHTTADIRTLRDIFELHGISMEPSINNREMFASSVHTALNEQAGENLPRIQFYVHGREGCPYLVRSIPQQRYNPKKPLAMADSNSDHGVVALAYFLMSHASGELRKYPSSKPIKPWMKPKKGVKHVLGSESVRENR